MLLSDSRVIPQFIQKSLLNEDLVIWGNGKQVDSFAYIDDIINYLINSVNYNNGLYTIGGNAIISIKDLAIKIIKLTNSLSALKFTNDYTSVRTLTGITYIDTKLNSGLINTINYFKNEINGALL